MIGRKASGLLCLILGSALWAADGESSSAVSGGAGMSLFSGGLASFRNDIALADGRTVGGAAILNPYFAYGGAGLELRLEPYFGLSSDGLPEIGFTALEVGYRFGELFRVRLGRFAPDRGGAAFLAAWDWLSGNLSASAVFDGREMTRWSDDFLEASVVSGAWRLAGMFAPFKPRFRPAAPTSPLFPRKDIKDSYETGGLLQNTYYLHAILPYGTNSADQFVWEPSAALEIGLVGNDGSVRLQSFAGLDRSYATLHKFTLTPFSVFNTYDLEVKYDSNRVWAIGLSAKLDREAYRVWLDAAYVDGRLYPVGDFYKDPGDWQATAALRNASWTLGASLKALGGGWLDIGAEWKNAIAFNAPDSVRYPFLYRAFYAFAHARFFSDRLLLNISGVYSLMDGSFVLSPSAAVKIGGGTTELRCSIPFGSVASELGQFGGDEWISLTLAIRF